MAKEKKPIKISKSALNVIQGIFICLLALFVMLSPNTIFSFVSLPVIFVFGFIGFWVLGPFIFVCGILRMFKNQKRIVTTRIAIAGGFVILAFLMILMTNYMINGMEFAPFSYANEFSGTIRLDGALHEIVLDNGETVKVNGYLEMNSAVDYYNQLIGKFADVKNMMYATEPKSIYLAGGFFGYMLDGVFNSLFKGTTGTTILSICFIVVGVCLVFHHQIILLFKAIKKSADKSKGEKDDYEEEEESTPTPTPALVAPKEEPKIVPSYDFEDESVLKADDLEKIAPSDDDMIKHYTSSELEMNSFNNTHSLKKATFIGGLADDEDFNAHSSMIEEEPKAPAIETPVREEPHLYEPPRVEEMAKEEVNFERETVYTPTPPAEEDSDDEFDYSMEDPIIEDEPTPEITRVFPPHEEKIYKDPTPVKKPEPEPVKEEPKKPLPPYVLPSIDLLDNHENEEDLIMNKEACDVRVQEINDIFADLRIGATVTGYTVGPSITQYDILMDSDKSISIISRYLEDIQIRLGGVPARFEKLVAGKKTSGLEIENKVRATVGLKECFTELNPISDATRFEIPFGKGINSQVIKASLIKFPHLLVAGTTGSGKSVFLHSLLTTLLMRNTPDELRLLLIDPKKVEMNYYREIPHLLCPAITEASKAKVALEKMVDEMEDRYNMFAETYTNDIKSFNKIAESKGKQKIPYIVVLIDEYADLNDECKDIRTPVSRLAQKARTAGIHLIIATQRPSVGVIDGVIKSNIACRVALMVQGYHDSEVILGESGAEKLLNNGDMIISIPEISRSLKPRVQGCYVDTVEVTKVTDFIRSQRSPNYDPKFLKLEEDNQVVFDEAEPTKVSKDTADEDLYEIIKGDLATREYCSISYIQRTYGVGFPKAGRIFIRLQREGVVDTASDSSHGCKVLIRKEVNPQGLGSIEQSEVTFKGDDDLD